MLVYMRVTYDDALNNNEVVELKTKEETTDVIGYAILLGYQCLAVKLRAADSCSVVKNRIFAKNRTRLSIIRDIFMHKLLHLVFIKLARLTAKIKLRAIKQYNILS